MPMQDSSRPCTQFDLPDAARTTPGAAGERLVYVVGPSGAGKDSVIAYARARLRPESNVVFARRSITRPPFKADEDHVPVSEQEFDTLLATGAFAMHWRANGLAYGIGREICTWLDGGSTVVVSGSREYLSHALADFPAMRVVHVTAAPGILRERMISRGREDPAAVEARLARAAALTLPEGIPAILIRNDGRLEVAGSALLECLESVAGKGSSRVGTTPGA